MSAANSRLPECELDVTDGLATVEAVADRYGTLTASTRRGIETQVTAMRLQPIC